MAQLSDFISRIFSTDRTQGLSGGAEVVIDPDPASAFYAARLRKHRTDEDLVASPEWLWTTTSYQGRKGGLRAHIHAERGDGVASFTDACVVLNQADWARALAVDGWIDRAAALLGEKFSQYCTREKFELLYGTRPLRFQMIADGGSEMGGQSFNLGPGEYVTGLLPNLYIGPALRSRPVLAVHVNLPGVWEGYREVGRLYSDQILFTLGRHWLDNFSHPSLREPGLYRLQQYPDGSLVHVISPELQDRFLVRSDSVEGGASVLTIAEWNGTPVAYLVLAVVESMTIDFSARPDIAMPFAPADKPASSPRAVVHEVPTGDEPDMGPATFGLAGGSVANGPSAGAARLAGAASSAPAASGLANRAMLSKTIVPGAIEARILTLHERGALLQKVHFSNFMDGYDVYIGPGGRIATQMTDPRATLQVRGSRVSLVVADSSVTCDGRTPALGKPVTLRGEVVIEVDGSRLLYRDLSEVRIDGWPYLAELRRPGAGSYLEFGQPHRLGRDRRCKVRLPDEPHNENIAWLPSVGGGTTIRSRTGDIPKSRFYTDSIMVASEHAEVDLRAEPVLRSLARHCFTYVRRNGEIVPLFPREGPGGRQDIELLPNDEVLIGNCLFQVGFPAKGQGGAAHSSHSELPASIPEISRLSPSDLASQVDGALPSKLTVEPPSAGALGERGPAPRPVKVDKEGNVAPSPRSPKPEPVAPPRDDKPPPPMMLGTMSFYLDPPKVLEPSTDPDAASSFPDVTTPNVPPVKPIPAPPRAREPEPARAVTPPVATAARVTRTPTPPAGSAESTYDNDAVVVVEESALKFELSRPAKLVHVGWMISGDVVIGNHRDCAVVIPELRWFKEQMFLTLDYFRVSVRGRRGKVELLQDGDATLKVADAPVASTDNLDGARLSVVRRDANLEPDFDILLDLVEDPSLPDPRARMLRADTTDRLVAALFTLGCPIRNERSVRLGPLDVTVFFDGERLKISNYLPTYRLSGGGFRPFFVREGERAFRTVPEDGGALTLSPGDMLIAGASVYRFQAS